MELHTIIFLILLMILVIYLVIHNRKHPAQFDERQKILRGRAFMHAFYAMVIFECLCYCAYAFLDISFPEPGTTSILAIFIGVLVLGEECILVDAFVQLNQSPDIFIALFLLNALNMGLSARRSLLTERIIYDGCPSTSTIAAFAAAICFFIWAITMLVKMFCRKVGDDA